MTPIDAATPSDGKRAADGSARTPTPAAPRSRVRFRSALALAGVMLLAVFASARGGSGWAADIGAAVAGQPTPEPGNCAIGLDKYAAPEHVRFGETVQVTLVLTATCNSTPAELHIVLVVDASTTDAQTGDEMKDKLVELVQHLDLDERPWIQVGVVEYKTQARVRCALTNQESRAFSCVRAITFDGGSRTDLGIQEGMVVLRHGRNATSHQLLEVMLVTMTGTPSNGCGPASQAAADAKGEGVLLMSVAVGGDADVGCARQLATSPRYAFNLRDWTAVIDTFDRIIEQHASLPRPATASITDTLPIDVEYVLGSAVPAAVVTGRNLIWHFALPPDTITMTFAVRPLVPGLQPTNTEARGHISFVGYTDVIGIFPVPEIDVIPNVSPTVSPTATAQNGTPEPTNTNTPVGGSWSVYLPDASTRRQ